MPSARWQNWDYRNEGAYFITICTKNRKHYFGKIVDDKIDLSCVGIIADILWYEIKNHSKNVELGEFIVMPNHIHGIIILDGVNPDNVMVETLHATSLQKPPVNPMGQISPKPGSVSTIIRSYKSAVTKHAHRLGFEIEWQERFHDHVIRDNMEHQRISQYIINNPQKWENDKFNH